MATSGFALGYLSGGLLLALLIAMTLSPGTFGFPVAAEGETLSSAQASLPARLMFVVTAAWWLVFSFPILLRVPEPQRRLEEHEQAGQNAVVAGIKRLGGTFRQLRRYRDALTMLVAFLIYNDGILTIIRMATIYGSEIGIEDGDLYAAILMVQFVAVPFSALFGALAGRIGTKQSILVALAIYLVVCVFGWRHADDDRVLRPRRAGGHGTGRRAGPVALAVREHDPRAQVG